jgi:hypothetical protein
MDFYFYKLNENNTFTALRFEVDIDSLPIKEKPFDGYEIVA